MQVATAVLSSAQEEAALRRNKSFIWFVVFLTEGSWSRNKGLLSIPYAPMLLFFYLFEGPRHVLIETAVDMEA